MTKHDFPLYIHTPHPWRGVRPWSRHSLVLFVGGFIYMAIGGSYIANPAPPARTEALQIALAHVSMDFLGWLFVFAGILSIISSRWPPVSKTWGYMVLTGLSSGFAAIYAFGVIFGDAPVANFVGTLSWGLFGFLWWAISGLVDPDPRT